MRRLRTAFALVVVVLLCGCFPAPDVKVDEALSPADQDIGFLLVGADPQYANPKSALGYSLGRPQLELAYRPAGDSHGPIRKIFLGSGQRIALQRVPAGEYQMRVAWFNGQFQAPGWDFRVEAATINYLGDFSAIVHNDEQGAVALAHRTVQVVDNLKSTEATLKTRYPVIAGKYPIRSEIMSVELHD